MLNHHVNKNPAASGDPFDAILGSTAIKGTCDSRLSLVYQHDRSERKLWVQGRVIQTTSHVIDLQPDSGWSYVADGASYAETTEQQEILDIMDADDAMSPKDVATQLDKNPSTVRGLFGALELEGKIVRQSRGRYTRAY
jgi:predicted Rossmann fold nucleotide-binding protein DprA/Smf involved in DNA uptake